MKLLADFHLHTKYSAATSPRLNIDGMVEGAKKKGLNLLATGDFTHPLWLREMKGKLTEEVDGLYPYRGVYFIQSVEVSNVFSLRGKTYKMHSVILAPSFEVVEQINEALAKYGNLKEDGRPTLSCSISEMLEQLKSISRRIGVIPAHIWTPWFSLYGSKFGADSWKEVIEDTSLIVAVETGLSSDPPMNWMLSELDGFTLVSNSDAHSPESLGREANLLEVDKPAYDDIVEGIRTGDGMLKTYEYFPQEGKYFYDGHRKCNLRLSPEEAEQFNNICPVCKRPLTLGVLHRVSMLADRKMGEKRPDAKPFQHIIPLDQLLAKVLKASKTSKRVKEAYEKIIRYFGNEFAVFEAKEDQIRLATSAEVADALIKLKHETVSWLPGYDGVFGEFFFGDIPEEKRSRQKSLLDFG